MGLADNSTHPYEPERFTGSRVPDQPGYSKIRLVPLHRGFDVSAERRSRVPNVWPGENQSASYGLLRASSGRTRLFDLDSFNLSGARIENGARHLARLIGDECDARVVAAIIVEFSI